MSADKPLSVACQGSSVNIEEYLGVLESPDKDYNFFRDRWTSGTCNWILSDEAFIRWQGDIQREPRVLWIHGNAATGKSTLSTFVIDHLIQLGLPCHYFYIRFMEQKKRALSMILRSLACQVAHSTPEYADKLRQLEAAGTDLKSVDFRNIWQWLYKQSMLQLDVEYPLYWVIDGIDEADSPGSVIRLLSELHLAAIPLRVLVMSRKTHEISSAIQKLGRHVHMDTVNMEGNQNDFRLYIDQELDVAGEDSYREAVVTQLLQRARGNFLWLHLAVQKINNCHTKIAVEEALKELPPAMEDLYDRMALSVQGNNDQDLGQGILGWTACAQRPLSVEEVSDALGSDGFLEIHRTIGDLSGGFVVVDKDGKASMIHETARRYLLGEGDRDQPFAVDRTSTNDKLFRRCIQRLMDPTLRGQINRKQFPALLDYAASSWFIHLSLGSATDPDILEALANFLRGLYVITWINFAARRKELRSLVAASRYLASVALKLRRLGEEEDFPSRRQIIDLVEGWATDLIKIVGKFGNSLIQNPDSIYKLIPPFCPKDSIVYQQFGRKKSKILYVSGLPGSTWDDCLARFSMEHGVMANVIVDAGSRIVIQTNIRKSSQVLIYNSGTFEEQRRITQPERVFRIQINKLGDLLVTYGHTTTRVWDMASGNCIRTVKNPVKRPRPHTLLFCEQDRTVLVGSEDRCVRVFSLDDDSAEWRTKVQIDEQSLEETIVNFPTCSALSPCGTMIAFGYRGHPATVWELEPPMLLGQCYLALDAANKTTQKYTWGEVFQLIWHPFSGEVLGLTQVGQLFKWDPHEGETSAMVQTLANRLTISCDGSLVSTGDAVGTIKIYTIADFSLLYQLSSQDPVLNLSFSTDSRKLYDIRGSHGNVWEPNILARLADSAEYPDRNSDTLSETESLTKLSLQTEHHLVRVDRVMAVSGQSAGPLYCYGTEGGVAVLCEIGRGKVCELVRSTSYMPIEHVAFNDDGTLVAIIDLSGRLFIRRIDEARQNQDPWQVNHELYLAIPLNQGHINQLLFQPTGRQLIASTAQMLHSIDLDSHDLVESTLPPGMSKAKWICHPTIPEYLLGFEATKVHVFTWSYLREVGVHSYSPPRVKNPTTSSSSQYLTRDDSISDDKDTLGRLISNSESPYILLEISHSASADQPENEYLMFTVTDIPLDSGIGDTGISNKELPYTLLPADVTSRMREPLSLLPRRRLIFLDVDRWICTWNFPPSLSRRPQGRQASQSGNDGIEQHYFVPGDWVTTDEAHLCTVMADGTFLCPRSGAVAAVQSAKLRKRDIAPSVHHIVRNDKPRCRAPSLLFGGCGILLSLICAALLFRFFFANGVT